jgi:hypothetical protein
VQSVTQRGTEPHDFLRHATAVDAGTAQAVVLDYRAARPVTGRAIRNGNATAAATDRDQIEFL